MYKGFLKDISNIDFKDEENYSLSKLVLLNWVSRKLKNNDIELEELIIKFGKDPHCIFDDEDIEDIFFMYGYKKREDERLSLAGFKNRIEQYYGLEFYYMDLIYMLSLEIGDLFNSSIAQLKEHSNMNDVIQIQHSRICSVYAEIIHLLKGGFGNGAMTRFRTMHETAVISQYIHEIGEKAAQNYMEYIPVMRKKDLNFIKDLYGPDELLEKELEKIKVDCENIKKSGGLKYLEYKKSDYIWASEFIFNEKNLRYKKPVSFNLIRKSIERKNGLEEYKIASNNIHAAPTSLISSISSLDGIQNPGASNIGIAKPGAWSTYEIVQLDAIIMSLILKYEDISIVDKLQALFILTFILKLSNYIYEDFQKKEDELLEEDE